ncbi:MAG TPA: adenylate/guanylate cyclase domain-containing protein [Paracoccaceae bacterium]|nr:adenylate/guanylate cyclase domain-containing protein [Paracoccaceae bacterium]
MSHAPLTEEIERWLLDEALHDADIVELFGALCARLHALGIPLQRAALSWPTLHPLFQAEQIYWRLEDGAELFQYRHDAIPTGAFEESPFHHVLVNRLARLRRRLDGPDALRDFPVLDELAEAGFTDYLMTATSFRIAEVDAYRGGASGIMASWATTRPGGFSDGDLQALTRVQKVFAVACHASIQKRVMVNLANAYLGRTAAAKALGGDVRRGDGETIRAVIWYSDLRRSTQLSNALAPEAYLQLLRDYYDCTAQPVIDEGGEILEFIGDAVLAIFPIRGETGGPDAVRAATRAMDASLAHRARCVASGSAPAGCVPEQLAFSIAMSIGDVMFGNIGVPTRLTFSAIGSAVNQVARLDELAKEMRRSVLVTREVAAVDPGRWVPLGLRPLRDFAEPAEVHGLAEAEETAIAPPAAAAS